MLSEKLKLVDQPAVREAPPRLVSPPELDEICSLRLAEDERQVFQCMADGKKISALLFSLSGRNLETELPVAEETFAYRRNLAECQKLKLSVVKLLGKKEIRRDEDALLLEDASKLFSLEARKAEWLEKKYYPALYGKALDAARGEVRQFLIKQKNLATLDNFPNMASVRINLKDELTYLMDGSNENSVGDYWAGSINISIPGYFTDQDEWKVYLVAVHELVHFSSFQDGGRLGIEDRFLDPDLKEINEAVTEILTFVIAQDHLANNKTSLIREDKNLALTSMAYEESTFIVKQILAKVSLTYFIDAMLNEAGLRNLSEKFAQVYGDENALLRFGTNLKNLYLPISQRKELPPPILRD